MAYVFNRHYWPVVQASITENKYQCAIIDTFSRYVWDYYLKTKDEVYSVTSDFCETEVVRLRGRDESTYELVLISVLGEAHSKKMIKLCNKYGIVKQSTTEYTPEVNAYVERWFRTNGEMSRCQLGQFDMDKEY
jgi:transposase InsO family protein